MPLVLWFFIGSYGGEVHGNVSIPVSVTLAVSATSLAAVGKFDASLAWLMGGTPAIGYFVFLFVMDDNCGGV